MYRSTIPAQRVGVMGNLEGRFSMIALGTFLLLSAGLALASAVIPERGPALSGNPVIDDAESDVREMLDDRLHLHLKRLGARG